MNSRNLHWYFIGIGGVGTVWLADWALSKGIKVSGSDSQETAVTLGLLARGAVIHYGAQPGLLPADITLVIINSAITESSPSYPELEEARRRALPIKKRAEVVGDITRQMKTIAVAGSHGKSTTTAMLGWILSEAGFDPTVFVGGGIAAWGNQTKIGKSDCLVLEADEFDRSFHHFQAQIAIILNIDADHLDYYKGGIKEIEHSFRRFLRNLPVSKGIVIGYARNASIRKVGRGFNYHFRWYDEQHLWPGLKLLVPGTHNLLNATAAARAAHELGVSHKTIKNALATFPGVGRRFEAVGTWGNLEVFDDYAHHPQEIQATLQAARERWPKEKLIVVFQAHQKARTLSLLKEFGRAFDQYSPDQLIVAPIYQVAGREENGEISNQDIVNEIFKKQPAGMTVLCPLTNVALEQQVESLKNQDAKLLIMGAGDIRIRLDTWRAQ